MTQVPEPVASFIETVNRHDKQGFLDTFPADGWVDDWGRVFTGRDAIEQWSDVEFIGSDGVLTPQEVSVENDTVTVIGDWRSTHANGLSSFAFTLDGDTITSMTIRQG